MLIDKAEIERIKQSTNLVVSAHLKVYKFEQQPTSIIYTAKA